LDAGIGSFSLDAVERIDWNDGYELNIEDGEN